MIWNTKHKVIVDDVKAGGEKSLIAHAVRLGDLKSETDTLILGPADMKAAYDALPEEDRQVLRRTKVSYFVFVIVVVIVAVLVVDSIIIVSVGFGVDVLGDVTSRDLTLFELTLVGVVEMVVL